MSNCPICFEEKNLSRICKCPSGKCYNCFFKVKCSFCKQQLKLNNHIVFEKTFKLGDHIAFIGKKKTGKTTHAKTFVKQLNTFSIVVMDDTSSQWGSECISEREFCSYPVESKPNCVFVLDGCTPRVFKSRNFKYLLQNGRHTGTSMCICSNYIHHRILHYIKQVDRLIGTLEKEEE